MTDQEAAAAVLAWAQGVLPELEGHGYAYLPAGKPKGLPDVAVELETRTLERSSPDFPLLNIQQALIRVRRFSLSFMAEAGTDEAGAEAATILLRTFADRLEDALLIDLTLGERVQIASPFVAFDYAPPLVQYGDGTIGRQLVMALAVGELVAGED